MKTNPLNAELLRRIEDALEERRSQRRQADQPLPVPLDRRGPQPGRRVDDSPDPGLARETRPSRRV
ncbi:MAG: hypothetical protein ACKO4A_04025 [Gammaproteobacteria bacterium]